MVFFTGFGTYFSPLSFSFLYFTFYTGLLVFITVELSLSFIKTFVGAENREIFSLYCLHIEQTNYPFSIFNHLKLFFNFNFYQEKVKMFSLILTGTLFDRMSSFIFTANLFNRIFSFSFFFQVVYVSFICIKIDNIYLEEVKLSFNN